MRRATAPEQPIRGDRARFASVRLRCVRWGAMAEIQSGPGQATPHAADPRGPTVAASSNGAAGLHPLAQLRTELVWEGKYDEFGNRREVDVASLAMPMQRIE